MRSKLYVMRSFATFHVSASFNSSQAMIDVRNFCSMDGYRHTASLALLPRFLVSIPLQLYKIIAKAEWIVRTYAQKRDRQSRDGITTRAKFGSTVGLLMNKLPS